MEEEIITSDQGPTTITIKQEELSDSEEVQCRLCLKCFASPVALRNHASMEHIEAFENGDPSVWTKPPDQGFVKKKPQRIIVRPRLDNLTVVPSALAGLGHGVNNVSYIIVKSESPLAEATRKAVRKESRAPTAAKEAKKIIVQKKAKAVQAITGPFECLEPSAMGADGVCHQIFFSCCEYSLHSRHEHTKRRRAPRCQVCERTLPARRGDDQFPYACETCDACFATDEELETHLSKAHIKVKPFACGVCHKRFTQQGGVLQHMRMHTGERPFPCSACNKAFTQKSGLDQHMRTHTKHKPYRCVVCSKTFIQSVHLKQHMRTHTNVAPFQCGICEKRFKQSSHLNYHLKNHDPSNLSEEQRAVYELLVGQITRDLAEPEPREVAEVYSGDVEVEIQESGQDEAYIIEAEQDVLQYND